MDKKETESTKTPIDTKRSATEIRPGVFVVNRSDSVFAKPEKKQ